MKFNLKCLIKHQPGKEGRYYSKSGNYVYKWKCERCSRLLGLPHLTKKYIDENYPMPLQRSFYTRP